MNERDKNIPAGRKFIPEKSGKCHRTQANVTKFSSREAKVKKNVATTSRLGPESKRLDRPRSRSGFGTHNIDGHRSGTKQADTKQGSSTHNIDGHRRAKQANTVKGRRASASTAGRHYT